MTETEPGPVVSRTFLNIDVGKMSRGLWDSFILANKCELRFKAQQTFNT